MFVCHNTRAWGKGLARKISDPITEFVVTLCDEASFIAVKGVEDVKCHATSTTMIQKIRGLDAISQEEGIHPILRP